MAYWPNFLQSNMHATNKDEDLQYIRSQSTSVSISNTAPRYTTPNMQLNRSMGNTSQVGPSYTGLQDSFYEIPYSVNLYYPKNAHNDGQHAQQLGATIPNEGNPTQMFQGNRLEHFTENKQVYEQIVSDNYFEQLSSSYHLRGENCSQDQLPVNTVPQSTCNTFNSELTQTSSGTELKPSLSCSTSQSAGILPIYNVNKNEQKPTMKYFPAYTMSRRSTLRTIKEDSVGYATQSYHSTLRSGNAMPNIYKFQQTNNTVLQNMATNVHASYSLGTGGVSYNNPKEKESPLTPSTSHKVKSEPPSEQWTTSAEKDNTIQIRSTMSLPSFGYLTQQRSESNSSTTTEYRRLAPKNIDANVHYSPDVNQKRNRYQRLPREACKERDEVLLAIKRENNRLAARRCREKRDNHIRNLESTNQHMLQKIEELKREILTQQEINNSMKMFLTYHECKVKSYHQPAIPQDYSFASLNNDPTPSTSRTTFPQDNYETIYLPLGQPDEVRRGDMSSEEVIYLNSNSSDSFCSDVSSV